MDKDGTNVVALVDLSNHDLSLFRSLAKLSGARERKYRVVDGVERQSADIFVINGDDPFAMKEADNLAGERSKAKVYVLKKPKDSQPPCPDPAAYRQDRISGSRFGLDCLKS